jgi:Tfp pilus assembly protein PilO
MNLNNNDANVKRKIMIISLVFALALFLIVFLVIIKNMIKITSIKEEIISEQIAMEQRLYEDKNKTIIENNLNKIEPYMDLLDSIFIDKNRAIEFLTALENAAKTNNVKQTINLSELKEEKSSASFIKTPISISCEGEYDDLFNYLADLEKMDYYININALSISRSKNQVFAPIAESEYFTAPKQILTMNIGADTFWKN